MNLTLPKNLIKDRHKTTIAFAAFALLIALLYGNTLRNGFVYDDHQQVQENRYIQSLGYVPKVFTGCVWESAFGQCKERVDYYRPVQNLSYLLTYQISSSPWLFHLVNLLYFFAAVFLVFLLARLFTKNFFFSLLAALIFLIHPVNTETVNWISAVPELTFTIFVLLSTIFYIKHRNMQPAANSFLSAYGNLLGTSFFYFLAMLSKETAIFLPILFVGIDLLLSRIPFSKLITLKELKGYFFLLAAFLLYLFMRIAALGGLAGESAGDYAPFSLGERIYGFFTLFAAYLGKLVAPVPLLFAYPFEKSSDLASAPFLFSFLIVGSFVLLSVALTRQKKLLGLIFLWIVVFLAPALLFLDNLGESVFSERYIFASSIGVALLASYLITHVWGRLEKGKIVLVLVGLLIVVISFDSVYARNGVWQNDEILYMDTLQKNPHAYRIRFNWAVLLRNEKGDFEAAKTQFETILNQNPNWKDAVMVYLHLGDYYRDVKKDDQKAFEYYARSISAAQERDRDWRGHFAFNRIGNLYAAKEEYVKAIPYFCSAVQIHPESETSQQDFDRAISQIQSTYRDDPAKLYGAIVQEEAFQKSEQERVRYQRRACAGENCAFVFSVRFEGQAEIILPFLIAVLTDDGEPVEITGSGFNPPTSEAMVQTDSSYKDATLTFVFPTCQGVYYEAVAAGEQ